MQSWPGAACARSIGLDSKLREARPQSEKGAGAGLIDRGAVAQLGERLICIQEVAGSIPTSSTSSRKKQFQAGL
jgi:hypothetical protein